MKKPNKRKTFSIVTTTTFLVGSVNLFDAQAVDGFIDKEKFELTTVLKIRDEKVNLNNYQKNEMKQERAERLNSFNDLENTLKNGEKISKETKGEVREKQPNWINTIAFSKDSKLYNSNTSEEYDLNMVTLDYNPDQAQIRGIVKNGVESIRIYYGKDFQKILKRGIVDRNNMFSVYVLDLNLSVGDVIKIVGLDKEETEIFNSTVRLI